MNTLPSPKELKEKLPLTSKQIRFIETSRQKAKKLLSRQDPRFLFILGPCSIHDTDEALEYGLRVKELAEKMDESCFLIMRAYIEKPRTFDGWKGLVSDPFLDESFDLVSGLFLARKLLLQLTEMGIPIATEFVSPMTSVYFDDLITWGFIGARTCSSQIHRQLASFLPMPIGFKNTLEGNVDCAINAAMVARYPQTFLHVDSEGKICRIQSLGNVHSVVVHRGSRTRTNYDEASIYQTLEKLRRMELPPRILIDCSHGNCQKQYEKQTDVFYHVLEQIRQGNQHIMGMMLESYLESGNQKMPEKLSSLKKGVSITDPCLNWKETEALIQELSLSSVSMVSSST